MADFDYKTAWCELAAPAYGNLPFELRELHKRVAAECRDLHQDSTLRCVWPEDPSLRTAFEAFPTIELAKAARAAHSFGHWNYLPPHSDGSHWTFASYCDQVISEREGTKTLSRWSNRDIRGLSLQIHEGFLRTCFSTKDSWEWEEIGLASEENFAKCRDIMGAATYSTFGTLAKKAIREIGMADPWSAEWLDKDRFMVDKSPNGMLLTDLRKVTTPDGWKVQRITTVNHKPHPFMIGDKHFRDGHINVHAADCARRGCGMRYEHHTSEKTAILEGPANDQDTIQSLHPWLVELKKAANGRVEGFAFVAYE